MLSVQATTYRIENFAGVCYAMSFGYTILIRHVLAQLGVRKVEVGAPCTVGSATRAWDFCGVLSVMKVENLCCRALTRFPKRMSRQKKQGAEAK